MKRQNPQQGMGDYIGVPTIEEYVAIYLAVCLDTKNNAFSLWNADKNAN